MWIKLNDFDDHLKSQQMVRKHVAFDASSFYRCLAEIVYKSQNFQHLIREDMVNFIKKCSDDKGCWKGIKIEMIEDPQLPGSEWYCRLAADCYKRPVWIYRDDFPKPIKIGANQFRSGDPIHLALSEGFHFDLVLDEKQLMNRSVAQSVTYEVLYVKVFEGSEEMVSETVDQMLRDKHFARLKMERKKFGKQGYLDLPKEISGLPPIPYRVAKALDIGLYRNVPLDNWIRDNKKILMMRKFEQLKESDAVLVKLKTGGPSASGGVDQERKFIAFIKSKEGNFKFKVFIPKLRSTVCCGPEEMEVITRRKAYNFGYKSSHHDYPHYRFFTHATQHYPQTGTCSYISQGNLSGDNSSLHTQHDSQHHYPTSSSGEESFGHDDPHHPGCQTNDNGYDLQPQAIQPPVYPTLMSSAPPPLIQFTHAAPHANFFQYSPPAIQALPPGFYAPLLPNGSPTDMVPPPHFVGTPAMSHVSMGWPALKTAMMYSAPLPTFGNHYFTTSTNGHQMMSQQVLQQQVY